MRGFRTGLFGLVLALAGAGAAGAGDFDTLRVSGVTPLADMMAGPGNTALLLSPDGGRLLHFGRKEVCLHEIAGDAPKLTGCGKPEEEFRGTEGLSWSPDGARVTWPERSKAFGMFRDADIGVFMLGTMTLSYLTDEGYAGKLLGSTAPLDLAAGWKDAETVVFVRHIPPPEGQKEWPPAALMSVTLEGKVAELLPVISAGGIVSAAAVAPGGEEVALWLDDRKRPETSGLLLWREGEAAPRLLVPKAAFATEPRTLAFSADGRFIITTAPGATGIDATLVEMATGRATALMPDAPLLALGWSPTGAALLQVLRGDPKAGRPGGLFLSEPPDAPGRLLRSGDFTAPLCCTQILTWARNDTLVLGNTKKFDEPVLMRFVR